MKLERHLYVPDTHAPYHDKRAWNLMLNVARTFKPDTIVTLGDLGDFYSVSGHSKAVSRDRKLKWEVDSINDRLSELDALGASRKVFIAGNHEHRLQRYLQDKAPDLFEVVDIPGLLKLQERKWEYVPYKYDIKIGKIFFTHDVQGTGRMAPFKGLDKYRHGVVMGHTHKVGYVVEGTLAGETQLAAVLGWLGDAKQIDYTQQTKAIRDCALAFGIGYLNPSNGCVYITPVPIVKYACVVEGKLFSG